MYLQDGNAIACFKMSNITRKISKEIVTHLFGLCLPTILLQAANLHLQQEVRLLQLADLLDEVADVLQVSQAWNQRVGTGLLCLDKQTLCKWVNIPGGIFSFSSPGWFPLKSLGKWLVIITCGGGVNQMSSWKTNESVLILKALSLVKVQNITYSYGIYLSSSRI